MKELLTWPAVWGLFGGLLSGLYGLMTAFSRKVGTPEARRQAWFRLAFGLVAGPITGAALTEGIVLKIIPALDMRGVALAVGWMVTNDPRALFDMLTRVVRAVFNQEPRS